MRIFALVVFAAASAAQTPGPALSVDAGSGRHPISPDIYGLNEYGDADGSGNDTSMVGRYPFTLRRWGGDNSVSYNWKLDSNNTASNWFFETFPINHPATDPVVESALPSGSAFDKWVARSQRNRIRTVATIPIIGWTTNTRREKQCSYSVQKYGPQKTDQWAPDCGDGYKLGTKIAIANDPHDVYMEVGPEFAAEWVRHVTSQYGTAQQGGVFLWELDNEPTWWHAVHRDIHPEPATFDETLERGVRWAAAVKSVDPTASIGGPTAPGWESYFYSAKDLLAGWNTGPDWKYWNDPVDRNAHGMDYIPWYLEQMRSYEQRNGVRLLDYLDIHAYVNPNGVSWNYDPAHPEFENLRLTSTRIFWDPEYMPNREDMAAMNSRYGTGTPQLIPRLKSWVAEHYPGTKTAITEYNWGALDRITGALAQADLLGIFGREGLDLAAIWDGPKTGQPGEFAWRMFLNYDGTGNSFGETSVSATSADSDRLSVFAAERADRALTVLVINKTPADLTSILSLRQFTSAPRAQVWQYSATDLSRISRLTDLTIAGAQIPAAFPAYSMTLFVVPAAAGTFTVPKPAINAVVNAASYENAVAPGAMVSIFGPAVGPETPVYYPALLSPDVLSNALGDVRVLFDGVPAPVIAVTRDQVNAIVPYTVSGSVRVAVEHAGLRSEPFTLSLAAAAPAVFTADRSGKGPGAILNNISGRTSPNSASAPAKRGSVISVFVTGEGLTNPPSIDGRIAAGILPKPVLPVAATIAGRSATVQYAGAAPGNTAGLMQVNVEIPEDAPSGAAEIRILVGGTPSQAGVTVAIE